MARPCEDGWTSGFLRPTRVESIPFVDNKVRYAQSNQGFAWYSVLTWASGEVQWFIINFIAVDHNS